MKVYQFTQQQWLPLSMKEAWEFITSPRHLEDLTPPEMGFEIVSLPSEVIYEGEIITYRVKIAPGLWWPWVSEIKAVDEGKSFIDDQISGPNRFWHHRHSLEEKDGGVILHDLIHYSIGYWLIGDVMNNLIMKPRLKRVFDYRQQKLEERFGKKEQDR